MNQLEKVANSIHLAKIPFEQRDTTFRIFLMNYIITQIKENSHLKFQDNNNPFFQLRINYEDERYLLAVNLGRIKKPSEYTKQLEKQLLYENKIDGAILLTSLSLNKMINQYLKKFPTAIVFKDYWEQRNYYEYTPNDLPLKKKIKQKETLEETHKWLLKTNSFNNQEQTIISNRESISKYPELEKTALISVNLLQEKIFDLEEGRISEMDLFEIAEETQTYLRFLGKDNKYAQLLSKAYELIDKNGSD